jgi:hypothetical protein
MFKSFPMRIVGVAAVLAVAAGCSSNKAAIYEHENFDDSGTFSRNYPVTDIQSCEAARRALLSQGYIITSNDPKLVSGHKSFQQTGENHMEISFSVVCADDGSEGHHATMFANALQDRYARSPAKPSRLPSSTSVSLHWSNCSCRRKRKRLRTSPKSRKQTWACLKPRWHRLLWRLPQPLRRPHSQPRQPRRLLQWNPLQRFLSRSCRRLKRHRLPRFRTWIRHRRWKPSRHRQIRPTCRRRARRFRQCLSPASDHSRYGIGQRVTTP